MVRKSVRQKLEEDRKTGKRLRVLKDFVGALGKRGLEDTFAAGEALEEAATLLRGSFSTWVKSECGIDPRTAHGFRKTFRVLGQHAEAMIGAGVAPSVAVTLASAAPEGRERALKWIASGRRLTVASAKELVRAPSTEPTDADTAFLKPVSVAARSFSASLLKETGRVVAAAVSYKDADEAALAELAVRARELASLLSVLGQRPAGTPSTESPELLGHLEALGQAEGPEGVRAAAAALVGFASGRAADREDFSGIPATPEADTAICVPAAAAPPAVISSATSAFRHGLTAFELCAGGGGQAAGLAKAGFRHVALVEWEKKPCETLRAAFGPEHVIEADLFGYEPADVGPVDLLAGGVPCQPFSKAGKKEGQYDNRDLFPEALRIAKLLKPRAIMLENVAGITDPVNDVYRFGIVSKLSRMGYRSDWWVLDCADFGVPQRRRRAILVAFRDPAAMARFKRPVGVGDYAEVPHTMASALDPYLRSRGYEPPEDLTERMNRVSPTVIGGSPKKQGLDLGQENTREEWEDIGIVGTRWGHHAPGHDHLGPILPTNRFIATLQGFPFDWPLRGGRRDVYRQIGNAFPPVVAMHLGLAIAEALTGETFDPMDQVTHEAMRWNHVAGTSSRTPAPAEPQADDRATAERVREIPLATLRESSSMAEPEVSEGDDHDIDFDRILGRFGPWPADLWKHQRRYGRI